MSMTSGGVAYALTGDREKDLEQYVGQRVEIVGRVEGGANRSGSATGGGMSGSGTATSGSGTSTTGTGTSATSGTSSAPTSGGTTTTGAETTTGASATGSRTGSASGQSFGNLQQVNIVSFRAIGGSCSAQ